MSTNSSAIKKAVIEKRMCTMQICDHFHLWIISKSLIYIAEGKHTFFEKPHSE